VDAISGIEESMKGLRAVGSVGVGAEGELLPCCGGAEAGSHPFKSTFADALIEGIIGSSFPATFGQK